MLPDSTCLQEVVGMMAELFGAGPWPAQAEPVKSAACQHSCRSLSVEPASHEVCEEQMPFRAFC